MFVCHLRATDGGHSVEDSHSGDSNLSPAVDRDVMDLANALERDAARRLLTEEWRSAFGR